MDKVQNNSVQQFLTPSSSIVELRYKFCCLSPTVVNHGFLLREKTMNYKHACFKAKCSGTFIYLSGLKEYYTVSNSVIQAGHQVQLWY
jgi:hypothetical protein